MKLNFKGLMLIINNNNGFEFKFGTGLSKPHPLTTPYLIGSFKWDGQLKECEVDRWFKVCC